MGGGGRGAVREGRGPGKGNGVEKGEWEYGRVGLGLGFGGGGFRSAHRVVDVKTLSREKKHSKRFCFCKPPPCKRLVEEWLSKSRIEASCFVAICIRPPSRSA